jgi:carotenoid 1,2-hydratase
VLYDVTRRDGGRHSVALAFGADGAARPFDAPPIANLPPTRWRVARSTRTDAGSREAVVATLEDTPFYARSLVAARLNGEPVTSVHESLDLDRFRSCWVQALLPFRAPRARR